MNTAVIVGASLSGLMTGLALSRAGVDVTMLERVDEFPRTGASLGWVTEIPAETFRQLEAEADALWPALWSEVIRDSIERRAVIGTPIAEYVPDRLVNGRLALVGDAAHVPTPMTGRGFSASLDDAEAIAEAVAAGV